MFTKILFEITLPVFLMIGTGVLISRFVRLDIHTLTSLSFNVLLPALVFIKTYDARLSPAEMGSLAVVNTVQTLLIFGLGWLLFSLPSLQKNRPTGTLSGATPNAGNYGIPLAALAFGSAGADIMAVIVMIQVFFTITLGVWLLNRNESGWLTRLLALLRVPLFWAGALALILSYSGMQLPAVVRLPVETIGDGLVPVALITLGVQLGHSRVFGSLRQVSLITLLRLVLSPLLAAGVNWLWHRLGGRALGLADPVLIAAAGMPVAVNVFILAAQYNEDQELASQSIFWTTILSALTLTAILSFYT